MTDSPMSNPVSGHWSDDKTFEEDPVSVGDLVEQYAVRADELSEGGQYAWWTELAALLRLQAYQLGEALEQAEVAEYKLGNIVNIIQPAILARALTAEAKLKAARQALEPSAETKAAYIGEFQFTVTTTAVDECDEPYEVQQTVTVPWTTIKEIMAAIRARAALNPKAPS